MSEQQLLSDNDVRTIRLLTKSDDASLIETSPNLRLGDSGLIDIAEAGRQGGKRTYLLRCNGGTRCYNAALEM